MEETISKSVHKKTALKKGDFGNIQYWGFNDSYIFLNFDKEKLEHLKSLDEVDILSKEDSDKIWKEKDVRVKDKDGNEKRPLQIAVLKLRGTTHPTGKWMMDFCNEIGSVYAIVTMFEKLVEMYNETSLKKLQKKSAYNTIAFEYMMMNDFSERAFEENLSEEEILDIVGKYKSLPKDWKVIKMRQATKELEHYMKIAEEVELDIQVTPEADKKKVLKAEETLVKNVKEETLKTEYNGHAPYGRGACDEINKLIERRDKGGGSADVKLAKRLIGEKIYIDGTGCYYCGAKLGVHVKDENNAEYFMWERGENYNHKIDILGVCEMSDKKSRVHTYELNFPTGEVVVDNYFIPVDGSRGSLFDIPKDEQYSDKYSLQTLKGRFNRQDYLSKTHNLGYAQMGNMSMDVFVSKDGNKLIFGEKPGEWDEKEPTETDDKFNKKFEEEYTYLGNISLTVWCWECADKKTLTDAGHSGEGKVVASVTPGTYVVKHFYGSSAFKDKENRYNTYSEITLKK